MKRVKYLKEEETKTKMTELKYELDEREEKLFQDKVKHTEMSD